MTEALRVTYINCDFCTAKNHCTACGGELAQALRRFRTAWTICGKMWIYLRQDRL